MAPMYDFECECGYETECLVAMKGRDEVRIVCPKCGKKLKRKVTAAKLGNPPHRTQAILGDGRKVSGDWDKKVK